MRKPFIGQLVSLAILVASVLFAISQWISVTEAQETLQILSPLYPYEAVADPGIPTLQVIVGDAATDEEAISRVLEYYKQHQPELQTILGEENPDRLFALFAMYVIHISHIYGVRTAPASFLDYLSGERTSHCGMYSRYQAQILDAYGMTWRVFAHDIAEHAWVEVKIDGRWEVFDSTVNVWINTDGYSLIAGEPREYRTFYTPMNDIHRPDGREHYYVGPQVGWWNMPRLRMWMPGLGLYYTPAAPPEEIGIGASVPGEGSDYNQPWHIWYDTDPALQ